MPGVIPQPALVVPGPERDNDAPITEEIDTEEMGQLDPIVEVNSEHMRAEAPEPSKPVIGVSVPEGMDFSGRLVGPQPAPCPTHRYGTRANMQRSTLLDMPPLLLM